MIDDSTLSDAARTPGDEAQVSARTGVRASTKKTTKKAAKKTAEKTTKKAAGAGGRSGNGRARKKTAKKAVKKAAKPAESEVVEQRGTAKKAARKAAKPAAAASAASEAAVADIAVADPAPPDPAVPDTLPPETSPSAAAVSGNPDRDAAVESAPSAAKRALPVDAARRLGPAPPGAYMPGTESEERAGLGRILALWGPLIIVGFLVLVFLGEDEREGVAAGGHDVPAPVSAMPSATAGTGAPAVSEPAPEPADPMLARAFGEAGASPLPAASRAAAAWTGSAGAWPAPPGPYRNPGSRELPSGERWVAYASEWAPSADGRGVPGYGAGGEPPPRWVRCEAPYYWCPAPGNPAW